MNVKKTSLAVSKKMNALENRLSKQFVAFYKNKIIPFKIYPMEFSRQKYENDIKTMIRLAVQEAYIYGNSVVGSAMTDVTDTFQVFISITDVTNISNLTNNLNNRFWKTVGKLLTRTQEVEAFGPEDVGDIANIVRKEAFNTTAALITVAGSVAWKTYNNAIVSKLTQIIDLPALLGRIPLLNIAGAPQPTIDANVPFDFFRLEETPTEFAAKVMFLTAEDARVDPDICEPLNRLVFDLNRDTGALTEAGIETLAEQGLSFVPEPPLHDHCRCRLIPIIDEAAAIGEFQNDLIESQLQQGTLT